MWLGIIAGWILGSAAFYAYLVATAKEPRHTECMDCRLSDCAECPLLADTQDTAALRRAA